jgi:hypothetical protein
MFEVKVEGFDQLLKQIEALPQSMPQELADWQRDDMHRKYPNTTVQTSGDETAASTEVWPHSRLEAQEQARRRQQAAPTMRGPARFTPKQHRVVHAGPKQHRGPVPRSSRPILRDELKRKLHDRMVTLTSEAMKWP